MKIALIGYGKMGRTIEALGIQQGISFPLIIDENNPDHLISSKLAGIDAAIEFSTPAVAPENITKCIDLGIPVVSGTTGWNEKIPEIEAYCLEKEGALFHASNFSIGVNILFSMNRKLAKMMEQFPQYNVSISEVHHTQKLDAPSGTAITLAEQIMEANREIKSWYLKEDDKEPLKLTGQIPIEAVRKGEVRGKHTIHYESDMDSIMLSHDAKTRDAFAAGALLAATFIKDRKGVFGMQDLLKL